MMKNRIIQLAGDGDNFYALTDDGEIWEMVGSIHTSGEETVFANWARVTLPLERS